MRVWHLNKPRRLVILESLYRQTFKFQDFSEMSDDVVESSDETFEEPDVKVILLGDSAVGKSKLVERYLQDNYDPRRLSTHALTLYRKDIALSDDGSTVKVDFWDTAGQEKYNSMHSSYYYKAHVCILVFDVTRKQVRA